MPRVPADESLPERLRRLAVNETTALVERIKLRPATQEKINDAMERLRNTASSAIARASDSGRKYHRDSVVNLDEDHNPLVTVVITRVQ